MDNQTPKPRVRPGRIVVTGGAGFIGSWTCERLLATGCEVVAVDSLLTASRTNIAHLLGQPRFTLVEQDISASLEIDGPVDLVLHLASPASPTHYLRFPVETLRVGSEGTTHALDLAERTGARFLLASTSEVYGDPLEHPQREAYWGNVNSTGPRSVYDEAKRYAEALTTAYRRSRGVDTTIARIFNTYGPRMAVDDGRVVPTFAGQALHGRPLTVSGDGCQTRSLCYVDDTVDGLLRLAASDCAGPVNIGNDAEITILELAQEIRRATDSASPVEFVPLPQDDPRMRRPDLTVARRELGWAPRTPLRQGLLLTLPWIAAQLGIAFPTPEAAGA
jgi:dTDP-glucose 4,6-dehydratase